MSLVQPIVVTLTDSHERIVTTAARASLLACSDATVAPWKTWLSGLFTKTVRRVNPKDLEKITALPEAHVTLTGDEMTAVAFSPMSYDSFPKALRKTQVQGTQALREAPVADEELVEYVLSNHSPVYLINDGLGMSTGKTAAQLAHAYWMMWLRQQALSPVSPEDFPHPATLWVDDEVFQKYKVQAVRVVTDSGLTELSGPTDTVIVVERGIR